MPMRERPTSARPRMNGKFAARSGLAGAARQGLWLINTRKKYRAARPFAFNNHRPVPLAVLSTATSQSLASFAQAPAECHQLLSHAILLISGHACAASEMLCISASSCPAHCSHALSSAQPMHCFDMSRSSFENHSPALDSCIPVWSSSGRHFGPVLP